MPGRSTLLWSRCAATDPRRPRRETSACPTAIIDCRCAPSQPRVDGPGDLRNFDTEFTAAAITAAALGSVCGGGGARGPAVLRCMWLLQPRWLCPLGYCPFLREAACLAVQARFGRALVHSRASHSTARTARAAGALSRPSRPRWPRRSLRHERAHVVCGWRRDNCLAVPPQCPSLTKTQLTDFTRAHSQSP